MFHLIFNVGGPDLRMFASNVLQTDMPWSTCSRLVQNKIGKKKSFRAETPDHFLAFLMACSRWGHVFATSANPRSC